MVFRGTIVRHCLVWRQWRERRATGGLIEGVQFSFVPGDNYATGDLSAAEVTRLRALPQTVRLEAFGAAEPPVSPQGEQMRQELLADVIDPSPPPPPLPKCPKCHCRTRLAGNHKPAPWCDYCERWVTRRKR